MSDDAPERDYDVGRGKPPAHTRFAPGRSGNSRGRPKGAKNGVGRVVAVLKETVVVTENGRKWKVSKLDAAIMRAANDAMIGKPDNLFKFINLVGKDRVLAALGLEPGGGETSFGDADDKQVLDRLKAEIKEEGSS